MKFEQDEESVVMLQADKRLEYRRFFGPQVGERSWL